MMHNSECEKPPDKSRLIENQVVYFECTYERNVFLMSDVVVMKSQIQTIRTWASVLL